ncbi:hypothetical protein PUN28_000623 [Cardiocondyla obscurior]|uniref:Uncharacterized protein n=1 Tax=Cardiocondyla obscurior TaxID=286306 RepID=A0AAW2H0A2_9HYME
MRGTDKSAPESVHPARRNGLGTSVYGSLTSFLRGEYTSLRRTTRCGLPRRRLTRIGKRREVDPGRFHAASSRLSFSSTGTFLSSRSVTSRWCQGSRGLGRSLYRDLSGHLRICVTRLCGRPTPRHAAQFVCLLLRESD